MERNRLIAVGVALTVVSGMFVVFVGIPAVQTHFHYERAYPAGETKYVFLWIEDFLEPIIVNVTFVDDPRLMYRIDVVQEVGGQQHRLIYQEPSFDPTMILLRVIGLGEGRVASINVVLGTGTPYDLSLQGPEMNVTVVYDNNPIISPRTSDTNSGYDILADCDTLTFIMTEDVQFNDTGMFIQIPSGTNLQIALDLPEGMNGRMVIDGSTDISLVAYGWAVLGDLLGHTVYRTSSTSEPLIDITVGSWSYVLGILQI